MAVIAAFALPHPPLILAPIGKGEEAAVQETIDSYNLIAQKIARLKPDTIIISSPHSPAYADCFCFLGQQYAYGDMSAFNAPQIEISAECDTALSDGILERAQKENLPVISRRYKLDHGAVVPLSIIKSKFDGFKLISLGISGLSYSEHYKLGKCIADAAADTDKKIVYIASGDLSHKTARGGPYGFSRTGVEFDKTVTDIMSKGDLKSLLSIPPDFAEQAAECGLRSFLIMAGVLDGKNITSKLYSYQGNLGVGYAVAEFTVHDENNSHNQKEYPDAYVRLAKQTVESYVKNKTKPKPPDDLPREMQTGRAGVFVSLKTGGNLRGCIGTIEPCESCIANEIIENAISACSLDPRFMPVKPHELPDIVYSVDVLMPAEPVNSIDMLNPKDYGVIVSCGGRRGLLLPDIEGVDTPKQQISIALRKAGIRENEKYSIERFKVVRHK